MSVSNKRITAPLPASYYTGTGQSDYQRFIKQPQKPKPAKITLLFGGWAISAN